MFRKPLAFSNRQTSLAALLIVEFTLASAISQGQETESSAAPAPSEAASEADAAPPSSPPADSPAPSESTTAAPSPSPSVPAPPPPSPNVLPPVAASPPPVATTQTPVQAEGQKHSGFALELHFNIDKPLVFIDDDFIDFSTVSGGLFLGGKIGRVIVGMAVDIASMKYRRNTDRATNYSYGYFYTYDDSYESSAVAFVFKPGVRFDIVQSKDKKVDLFGQVDFGAGSVVDKQDGSGNNTYDNDEKYLLIDWDGALGVRYWPHPQFAVAALGGVYGNFIRERDPSADTIYSSHYIGISGALQLIGVF